MTAFDAFGLNGVKPVTGVRHRAASASPTAYAIARATYSSATYDVL